ncbi:hypothetical protein TGGT1_205230 [Toxoplasma gondii GT1]|uniref:Uncharacterized protein n=2 Tax=Toxoplasma gondii TaxID=5811 RepID=S7UUY8_TOXGG|nr:hypothetical protein TGGT1_205230 [Toxoplasma gondii GT1]KFG36762.1 hypothetical protein TGFOU_205230 [Toxoplasma gondii FOU]
MASVLFARGDSGALATLGFLHRSCCNCSFDCLSGFLDARGCGHPPVSHSAFPPSGSIKRNQIEKRGRRTYRPNYSVQASIRNETTKVNVMIYVRLFKKEANHCRGNLRVIHT